MRAGWALGFVGLVVAVLVAVVALGRGREPRAIPWLDEPTGAGNFGPPDPRNVPPLPRGGRRCGPSDLEPSAGEPQGVNSVTTLYYIGVRNRGRTTCAIGGLPSVEIVRMQGGPFRIEEARDDSFRTAGYPPSSPAFGLAPGRRASAALVLYEDCRYVGVPQGEVAARIGVGAWRTIRFVFRTCPTGATLTVETWQPPALPEPPVRPWPLKAEIDAPDKARVGSVLTYRVRLENVSDEAFRFPYCPTHGAGLDGGDGTHAPLNCKPVGVLEPGREAVFEMRVRVSPHFAPGTHELDWKLDDDRSGRGELAARTPIALRR